MGFRLDLFFFFCCLSFPILSWKQLFALCSIPEMYSLLSPETDILLNTLFLLALATEAFPLLILLTVTLSLPPLSCLSQLSPLTEKSYVTLPLISFFTSLLCWKYHLEHLDKSCLSLRDSSSILRKTHPKVYLLSANCFLKPFLCPEVYECARGLIL